MACTAGRRKSCRHVVWIRRAREICFVTRVTIRRRICVVVVGVALGTGESCVHARQRIVGIERVIELRVLPICCGVADTAVVRECQLHMRRIVTADEFVRMARVAGCRSALEHIVGVAGCAGQRGMRTSERVAGHLQVIEFGIEPGVHGVAVLAGCGESCRHVIEDRCLKIFLMAAIAGSGETRELTSGGVLVAVVALQHGVSTDQREAILVITDLTC